MSGRASIAPSEKVTLFSWDQSNASDIVGIVRRGKGESASGNSN
jgi:hypothetical protein